MFNFLVFCLLTLYLHRWISTQQRIGYYRWKFQPNFSNMWFSLIIMRRQWILFYLDDNNNQFNCLFLSCGNKVTFKLIKNHDCGAFVIEKYLTNYAINAVNQIEMYEWYCRRWHSQIQPHTENNFYPQWIQQLFEWRISYEWANVSLSMSMLPLFTTHP